MARINVYVTDTDPYGDFTERRLAGYFDPNRADFIEGNEYWDGDNMACSHLKDGTRKQDLYRTARGRWVTRTRSSWANEQTEYQFIDDAAAREWLVINESHDLAEKWFGEQPDEEGPAVGGRPAIGPPVSVAYQTDLLTRVDAAAKDAGLSRAAWLRQIAAAAVGDAEAKTGRADAIDGE